MRREAEAKAASISIRHGDTVKIMTGRDKGKTGKVLSVNTAKQSVTVEHANMIKRHTRPNPSKNVRGGILEKEGPIHISNVLVICPGCGKHTRVAHKTLSDGTRSRACRRCGQALEG
ncbi:MAG TPA: 50S ribosomal protein L24 [Candidatus Acidoferrales bacterium]|nr:50S ribosomal protein L24 [Candidatus Acidoferrales bacterium]